MSQIRTTEILEKLKPVIEAMKPILEDVEPIIYLIGSILEGFKANGAEVIQHYQAKVERGTAYIVAEIAEIPALTTAAFVLSFDNVPEDYTVYAAPLNLATLDQNIELRIYEDTDYVGLLPVQYYNADRNFSDTNPFSVKVGASGTDKGTLLRSHSIWSTKQQLGGSFNENLPIKCNPTKNLLIEIENLGSKTALINYNNVLFVEETVVNR